MEYSWEKKARKKLKKLYLDMGGQKYMVMGISVANMDTVEADYIDYTQEFVDGITRADSLKDINGDTEAAYADSVERMRQIFGKVS